MTYIVPGDHNVICDRTGFKRKASQCQKQWDGLLVLKNVYEARHPQDFVRAVPDMQTVVDPRPDTDPVFVGVNQVTPGSL